MRVLVTGSSGHLGEALMRCAAAHGVDAQGLDLLPGPWTHWVGTITDAETVAAAMVGVDAVIHTATLHKPHVATHSRQAFVDTNITGSLTLLDAALRQKLQAFIFTSTTSAFGLALRPPPEGPAAWIDETVRPIPKNIYGVTKTAAEDLAEITHRKSGLPILILRTARIFPEEDDDPDQRAAYVDENAKANEYLFRRVDLEDAARAHLAALMAAPRLGFGRYIISATPPFTRADCAGLWSDPAGVVAQYFPTFREIFRSRGYRMVPRIDRVYDNAAARRDLGWTPTYSFAEILAQLAAGTSIGAPLARAVGVKGYHSERFTDVPYPVD